MILAVAATAAIVLIGFLQGPQTPSLALFSDI